MKTINLFRKLRREALGTCKLRGHRMNRLEFHSERSPKGAESDRVVAYCNCKDCGMQVNIHTHPQPDEVDIGGEAVALNCGPEETNGSAWNRDGTLKEERA
jgi:hypothetical protein